MITFETMGRLATAWVAALVLTACGTLPDASKLANASVQLRSAVGAAGSAVGTELRMSDRDDVADRFTRAWAVPEQTCTALVAYAEALADIVNSGERGAESVRKVAGAGGQLAKSVGAVLPPTAVGDVVNLAAFLYQQVAIAEASRSLEESLVRMQPAVDRISVLMVQQLDDAFTVLRSANTLNSGQLRVAAQQEFSFRERLRSDQRALFGKPSLNAAEVQRLEQIEKLEKLADARYEPTQKLLDANAARLRRSALLVDGTKQAVSDWAAAHRQLLVAVREKRSVDPQALMQSIQELRELIRKVKESS